MPKNTLPSRRASAPKKNTKTKPAAEATKPDVVTQVEIRAVTELYDLASDLAIEVRRRIENGARVQKGRYATKVLGGSPIADERRHRERCVAHSLSGLVITDKEAAHA